MINQPREFDCRKSGSGHVSEAECPLDVGFHLLELLSCIAPAVNAGGEIEHAVAPTRGDVGVDEGVVGLDREPLQESEAGDGGVRARQCGVGRSAVTAVDPDARAVGREPA